MLGRWNVDCVGVAFGDRGLDAVLGSWRGADLLRPASVSVASERVGEWLVETMLSLDRARRGFWTSGDETVGGAVCKWGRRILGDAVEANLGARAVGRSVCARGSAGGNGRCGTMEIREKNEVLRLLPGYLSVGVVVLCPAFSGCGEPRLLPVVSANPPRERRRIQAMRELFSD